MKRSMQRRRPHRFGQKPVATFTNLMIMIRRPAVAECYEPIELMEVRASIQRRQRPVHYETVKKRRKPT